MAKRFIDTGLFDDEWFSELSKDAKILWVYYLTKCDHAGMLKSNIKLIEFQTGIKSFQTVRQELGNRLITVNELLLFCPKFIQFQYPNFPHSKAPQTLSAISILQRYDIVDNNLNFKQLPNSYLTVAKDLPKTYGNGNDNVSDNGNEELPAKIEISELEKTLDSFYEMRRKIKKPATPHAMGLILKELDILAINDDKLKIDILNQSIRNSWQDVYQIKKNHTDKRISGIMGDISQMDYTL